MEKTLKEAVKANNIADIRKALVDIIVTDSGKTVPIETVTEVIETTPGLFDEDDGKSYADSAVKMTPALISQLEKDLKTNFSIDKFRLLTEVYALKAEKPGYYKEEAEVGTEPVQPAEELPAVTDAERVQMMEDAAIAFGGETESSGASARKMGIAIMILGCAAAIVGLCVPVKFLLGLGIGVFMLGTALTYVNLKR